MEKHNEEEKVTAASAGAEDAPAAELAVAASAENAQGDGLDADSSLRGGSDGEENPLVAEEFRGESPRVDKGVAPQNYEDGAGAVGSQQSDSDSGRLLRLIESDPRVGRLVASILSGEEPDDAIRRLAREVSYSAARPLCAPGTFELNRIDPGISLAGADDPETARVLSNPRRSVWPD